ncbi:transporter substrate-binding domain-containing protein [Falsirhodobacter halotolerans]|uniref:transporter substrate-binding domain-containing protein n=1 Tax=Falsirhodobacter halotolerans TaxID=1146892 RepID=UPI001FD2FB2F|nr:transporter substrate-binding domain-containing protein [Falsirhodobacter halotolerans]MCJ8139172.1 transporter substrate-binding domain-containing protein [Falsirhodobacter halotolerans]
MTTLRRAALRATIAATALFAGVQGAFADLSDRTVVFATEGTFPPSNMTRPNGELYGFEIDLVNEIAARAGFDVQFIAQAWDGMIQGLVDGKYNAVVDGVSITPARQEVVDFSLNYTTGGSTFVVMNESGLVLPQQGEMADLDDEAAINATTDAVAEVLKGKTVGVQQATIQSAFLEEFLVGRGVDVRTYPNGPDVYQDLLTGRLDAGIASVTNVPAFLERNEGVAMATGPIFAGGVMGNGSGVAIRKGDTELKEGIDAALRDMVADGTLKDLSEKWFGLNVTPTEY